MNNKRYSSEERTALNELVSEINLSEIDTAKNNAFSLNNTVTPRATFVDWGSITEQTFIDVSGLSSLDAVRTAMHLAPSEALIDDE